MYKINLKFAYLLSTLKGYAKLKFKIHPFGLYVINPFGYFKVF